MTQTRVREIQETLADSLEGGFVPAPFFETDWHRGLTPPQHLSLVARKNARLRAKRRRLDCRGRQGRSRRVRLGSASLEQRLFRRGVRPHRGACRVRRAGGRRVGQGGCSADPRARLPARYGAFDVRGHHGIRALENAGFRLAWSCAKMACEVRGVNVDAFPDRSESMEVVSTTPDHLPRLLESRVVCRTTRGCSERCASPKTGGATTSSKSPATV